MNWTHLWNTILHGVAAHPDVAYLTVFLISISESLAVVGLLVPGTVMMIGIGALAGSGALALKWTVLAAICGAILGDGLSYWLGRHFHQGIKAWRPFQKFPSLLPRGEQFFRAHGGKSVFLGRFVGPVRPVIPLIAGMLDMPIGHFLTVNILSAIGWAFAYLIPGVLLGSSLALVGAVSTRLSLFLLLVGAIIWLIIWLGQKAFRRLSQISPRGQQRFLPFLCVFLALCSWLFFGILEDLINSDPLTIADQSVFRFLQAIRTSWADSWMIAVTELGDMFLNALGAVTLLVILLWARKYRAAKYWLLTYCGGFALVQIFKWLLHRPRPVDLYSGVSSWAFPSGHTTMSAILFGFLAILVFHELPSRRRWLPFALAVTISAIIGFSRLYLGAHWLSDVLGGLSLGWAWVIFGAIFYLRKPESVPLKSVFIATAIVFLAIGGFYIRERHYQDLVRYRPQHNIEYLNFVDWQSSDWQKLPAWRTDLLGETEQPLSLQWAGEPDRLAAELQRRGWQESNGLSYKKLLNFFNPHAALQDLPLLPQLNGGEPDQLLMTKLQGSQRLVLRLWPSAYKINEAATELWVGSVVVEQAVNKADLLTLPESLSDYSRGSGQLERDLGPTIKVKWVKRPLPLTEKTSWDGKTLLFWSL